MPMPRSTIKAIEALVKAGGTITDAYKAGMVNSVRLCRYCKDHPAWEAKIRKQSEANGRRKKSLNSGHRNGTHCKRGHLLPKKPNCMSRGRMYRRCQKCALEADKLGGGAVQPELIQEVEAKIAAGATQRSMRHALKFYAFKKLCRENPKLDAIFKKNIAANSSVGQVLRYARERGLPPELEPTLIAVARLKHKIKTIRQQPKKETP